MSLYRYTLSPRACQRLAAEKNLFDAASFPVGGGKEPVKKRAALSIFEAEMLSQSVSYDFLPTIDIRKVI
jgi:hypothetical protein